MSILNSLVLPADVLIIRVSEASESIRQEFAGEANDFIITRPRVRANSQLIGESTLELLEEFRTPKTIVEAVINYGRKKNLDPEEMLADVALLAQNFLDLRLLAVADSVESQPINQTYANGDQIDNFQVIYCVAAVEDTEIYKVKDTHGIEAALKIIGTNGDLKTKKDFEREALVLDHLNAVVSPKLLSTGEFENRFYMVMEWIDGVSGSAAAAKLRNRGKESHNELIKLCNNILGSYSKLHETGIIHGDIHPRNIIVGERNEVKLIDFANSGAASVLLHLSIARRAGMAYFYEPEYAKNILSDLPPPNVNFLSEQFALGALIYYFLTGQHYIDFSLEYESQLNQIAEHTSPIPFSQRAIEPLPAIEAVLAKALSQSPEKRFASTEEFKRNFEKAFKGIETEQKVEFSNADSVRIKSSSVLNELIPHLELDGSLFRNGLAFAPTSSVYHGTAGIAYALYRISCIRNEARTLSLADAWITKADSQSINDDAFYNSDIQITEQTIGSLSPYHTISGIYSVQAHIFNALGVQELCDFAIEKFIFASSSVHCSNLDLTLGKSGSLLIAALLLKLSPQNVKLLNFGNRTMSATLQEIENLPPVQDSNRFELLGMAHGWAGILYAVMSWCRISGQILPSTLFQRLEELADYGENTDNGIRWQLRPKSVNQRQQYLSGWCNGSTGWVFLWTLAHQIIKEKKYLFLAELTAKNVYENPTHTDDSLCCGTVGRSYALLNIYKYTGESDWLKFSRDLSERAIKDKNINKKHLYSLYRGLLGAALLEADLSQPEQAAMPFFEATDL